jgi:hypothetical protein
MRPAKRFGIMAIALALLAFGSRVLAHLYGLDFSLRGISFVFVLSPDRLFFVMAAFSAVFAAAYSAFPMNLRAASWHFWVTLSGIAGFCVSFYGWTHLAAQKSASQAVSPLIETVTAAAFLLSFLVLLFSPAIFTVNFTFAMGRMRTSRTSPKGQA